MYALRAPMYALRAPMYAAKVPPRRLIWGGGSRSDKTVRTTGANALFSTNGCASKLISAKAAILNGLRTRLSAGAAGWCGWQAIKASCGATRPGAGRCLLHMHTDDRAGAEAKQCDSSAACSGASAPAARVLDAKPPHAPLWLWHWNASEEPLCEACNPAQEHANAPMTALTAGCDRDVGRGPPITSGAPIL